MIKIRRNCKKIERSCSELMPFHSFSPGCYARYWSTGDTSSLSMSVNVFVERFSPSTNGLVWQLMVVQNFVRGFSSWCEIWPFRTMKKPPCEIWTFHLPPLQNAFEIPCFETLLMIFHCRFSKIFCLTFIFVNTYFTLVINQWKGCFCNSSCNLAFYCL